MTVGDDRSELRRFGRRIPARCHVVTPCATPVSNSERCRVLQCHSSESALMIIDQRSARPWIRAAITYPLQRVLTSLQLDNVFLVCAAPLWYRTQCKCSRFPSPDKYQGSRLAAHQPECSVGSRISSQSVFATDCTDADGEVRFEPNLSA